MALICDDNSKMIIYKVIIIGQTHKNISRLAFTSNSLCDHYLTVKRKIDKEITKDFNNKI